MSEVVVPSTGPNTLIVQREGGQGDILLEQKLNVQILNIVKRMTERPDGMTFNMIGPIYVESPSSGPRQGLPEQVVVEVPPTRGDMQGLRLVSSGPDVSKEIERQANALFKKLPNPMFDCLLRMFWEYVWSLSTSPSVVAKYAGSNSYQAKHFGKKFGIVETS